MIATRKKLCLIYLGPILCFIGILYTVFYTEYKLPRMIKRMQNNIASNKELYFQNQTNEEGRKFSIFPPYYSNEKNEEQKYEETENNDRRHDRDGHVEDEPRPIGGVRLCGY